MLRAEDVTTKRGELTDKGDINRPANNCRYAGYRATSVLPAIACLLEVSPKSVMERCQDSAIASVALPTITRDPCECDVR
ncbi:MAG: hypothetical protein ACJ8AI_06495 [Rhodopila sp.]